MNIFALDEDPVVAAQMQCDKHVVKMPTESAQMLSTVHRILDGRLVREKSKSGKRMVNRWILDDWRQDVMYKNCHENHPCTRWASESDSNYMWLWRHFRALCAEYTFRYDKTHLCETKLLNALKIAPYNIPSGELSPWKLAMEKRPECKRFGDPVLCYRAFYLTKQVDFDMVWTKREIPEWFDNAKSEQKV